MAHRNGTGPTLGIERIRQFLETPEVATPWEVSRNAQQLLDALTVCGLNEGTIRAQQEHIAELEAKLAAVGPKKTRVAPYVTCNCGPEHAPDCQAIGASQ